MNEEQAPKKIEIPLDFHSFADNALFERCIECDRYLLEDDTEYLIEKAVKKYPGYEAHDILFEYAICMSCAENMRKRISKESMQHMEEYFAQNIDVGQRTHVILTNPDDPHAWIEQCMIKGTSRTDLDEYQVFAHCKGRYLEMEQLQMPYLLSGAVLDEMADLLSNETLDELDGFIGRHFGPPPELMEPLPKRRLVLI